MRVNKAGEAISGFILNCTPLYIFIFNELFRCFVLYFFFFFLIGLIFSKGLALRMIVLIEILLLIQRVMNDKSLARYELRVIGDERHF